jgi:hypothetical protein
MSDNKLLFRRQFILGDRPVDMAGWIPWELGSGLVLTAHPDLNVVQSVLPGSSLTLLGYMLDADHPEATDTEIIKALHADHDTIDSLVQKTELLSGRWILIYAGSDSSFIFHDVTGYRDIYYTEVKGVTWCGSQPHLMAQHLNLQKSADPDIISYFSQEQINALNFNWTTDYSPYKGILHLLPNHYLDLKNSAVKRFKLNFTPSTLPLHQAVRENCRIMANIMQAARHRYKLMIACTAGCDSRVQLAACRSIADSAYFYIYQFPNLADDHPDLALPAKLFRSLSLPFQIIKHSETEDDAFSAAYERSTMFPRYFTKPLLYHYYRNFPDFVNVSENTMPAFKVYFDRLGKPDAAHLANAYHQPPHPFILDWLQTWIKQAESDVPLDRMDISDLYFWEVFLGNQNGTSAAEQDISIEDLSPSNCRRIYLNFFSVAGQYHTEAHTYDIYRKMIRFMWPELLDFPFNPGWKTSAYDFLRKHNLYFRAKRVNSAFRAFSQQWKHPNRYNGDNLK